MKSQSSTETRKQETSAATGNAVFLAIFLLLGSLLGSTAYMSSKEAEIRNELLVDAQQSSNVIRSIGGLSELALDLVAPLNQAFKSNDTDTARKSIRSARDSFASSLRAILPGIEKHAEDDGLDYSSMQIAASRVSALYQSTTANSLATLDAIDAGDTTAELSTFLVTQQSAHDLNDQVGEMTSAYADIFDGSLKKSLKEAGDVSDTTRAVTVLGVVTLLGFLGFGFRSVRRDRRIAMEREKNLREIVIREKELNTVAKKLRASNRDLQDFAFVASHDLQEPLRKIVAFGDRLRSKHSAALEPGALDYLERMQSSASRMQTLISDLLSFSRVNTASEPFRPVDLGEIARGVASDLEIAVERAGGEVRISALPKIDADPTQMRQLLQNLISNALKFRKHDVAPIISVSATMLTNDSKELPPSLRDDTVTDWCQIEVSDNGIGFDEKYLDRIFKVFQRLHSRSEFEGSGVGLSVCRRIAERHRGVIDARSAEGQGTTFIVTLPLHQEEERSPDIHIDELLGIARDESKALVDAR